MDEALAGAIAVTPQVHDAVTVLDVDGFWSFY